MKNLAIVLFLAFAVIVVNAQTISITTPKDGDSVPYRPEVTGKYTSNCTAKICVLIQPTAVGKWWVQPSVTKDATSYRVTVYIGREGQDVGKHFIIRAVLNPKTELKEGDILSSLPEAQALSNIVEATKK